MGVLSNKIVISKGIVNEFIFTIKKDNETLPLIISPTDTFEVSLYRLDTDDEVLKVSQVPSEEGVVEIYDETNGQILVRLTKVFTDTIIKERGSKADRYYLKPVYRMSIVANTLDNGDFIAKAQEIYVD